MPDKLINYYRIEEAIAFLTDHFREQPELSEVAAAVHMSPYHFQRIFTDWVGISPKKFIQYLTLDYLKKKIAGTETMIDAADLVGMSSQSRVHDLFVSIEGVSPQQFKTSGKGLTIYYGYHASPFGLCFIAVAEKGICALKFIDEKKSRNEFELFSRQWRFATTIHRPDLTQPYIRRIFDPAVTDPGKLQLLVQGSAFQLKVWEALTKIPFGSVGSFQLVADMIGHPAAARAVGSAVGKNSILYLIPCHRIISQDGTMGNYHFGKVRKQAMIGWELSKAAAQDKLIG